MGLGAREVGRPVEPAEQQRRYRRRNFKPHGDELTAADRNDVKAALKKLMNDRRKDRAAPFDDQSKRQPEDPSEAADQVEQRIPSPPRLSALYGSEPY